MNLYIKIKNGVPIDHPIAEDNMQYAFPEIDLNNLPNDFACFERVDAPSIGVYEINDGCTYGIVDGVYMDIWNVRQMTNSEKKSKQDDVKAHWQISGYSSWIFNENTCSFDPPVERPNDGKRYVWNESTTSWVEYT